MATRNQRYQTEYTGRYDEDSNSVGYNRAGNRRYQVTDTQTGEVVATDLTSRTARDVAYRYNQREG